ncbi:MAG: D-alanyl-D-alanine carboxypeptidase family protein [Parcubacteria group bacterium]|jgi:D-alanyl-D-alanine carboxypeptidase
MNVLATTLIIVFLPFNYYFAGLFAPSASTPIDANSRVEGATDEKKEAASENEKSLKGSLSNNNGNNASLSASGYLPQRVEDYHEEEISAGSSVVIDADSGTILHYSNGRNRTPIASLTKIMTAAIVMEKVNDLHEQIIIDSEMLKAEGTKVGCPTSVTCVAERLHEGEKITVKSLLTAMLLDSANDAAIALGKHVAGSQKGFAELMNEKAKEIGLSDSHFCNPSGLDEDNCYSSAYDLARIAVYSMKYDIIWDIMKMQEAEVSSCDGKYIHQLKNTDLLLGQIPNCLGGKTGFTYNAGKSLMVAAKDPDTGSHRIVAVIINDNNRWEDMPRLIDWTFDNYEWK